MTRAPRCLALLVARLRAVIRWLLPSFGSRGNVAPRLILMIFAPAPPWLIGLEAYSIALITHAKDPEPFCNALIGMIVAPGAIPIVPIPLSFAAIIPATCVACLNVLAVPAS